MLFFISACSQVKHTKDSLDDLANCLAEKNVKEYGAFWCPNCAKQQKMFGSSYNIIKEKNVYVECDARGKNQQSQLCLDKNVQKYPDWEFLNGERLVGVQDLEILAEKAGCEKPILK
jgi:hypothetical protein